MTEWIESNETLFWWLAGASILTFIGTLIVAPLLAVRIPSDYFSHKRRQRGQLTNHNAALRIMLLLGKNLIGYVFIIAGVLMLVLPGQGLLTILIGIMLIDFPGKYQFERWLVTRRPVRGTINWLRQRAGRGPLIIET